MIISAFGLNTPKTNRRNNMAELYVGLENGQKKLIPTSSEARSGNPLGTFISLYAENVVPIGYVRFDGQEYDPQQYPALYGILGTNKTLCLFDKSRLGDYEDFEISTSSSNPTIIPYDGFLYYSSATNGGTVYNINGVNYNMSYASGNSVSYSIPVKKGDIVYALSSSGILRKARFYKHYLCIKATSGLEETQQDYVLQSLFTTLPIVQQVTFYTPTPSAVGFSSSIDFKDKLSTAGYDIDDFDEVTFSIGSNSYNNLGFSDVTILRVESNRGIGVSGQTNTAYFNWSTGVLDAGLAVHSATFRKYGTNTKIIEF